MTLSEAADHVNGCVVYGPHQGEREDGTIVRVGTEYVFVDFRHGQVKATRPEDLVLLGGAQ